MNEKIKLSKNNFMEYRKKKGVKVTKTALSRIRS